MSKWSMLEISFFWETLAAVSHPETRWTSSNRRNNEYSTFISSFPHKLVMKWLRKRKS